MKQLIPLLCSFLTIRNMWLAGNHDYRAWGWGLVNQVAWTAFIITFNAWGLFPLTIILSGIYIRNLWKWKKEEKETVKNGEETFNEIK